MSLLPSCKQYKINLASLKHAKIVRKLGSTKSFPLSDFCKVDREYILYLAVDFCLFSLHGDQLHRGRTGTSVQRF